MNPKRWECTNVETGGTIATASAVVTEVPWNEYTDEVKDSVSFLW